MIKLIDLLKECVIAAVHVDGDTVLAKNRDRGYTAKIRIVHELMDGVEVVYWLDEDTDWCEGMNEHGIGIVNSSLLVGKDEKESDKIEKKQKGNHDATEKKITSTDGLKIRHALKQNSIRDAIESVVSYVGKDKKDVGVKGHVMVATPKVSYNVESTSKNTPIITKLDREEKTHTRSNHGISHEDAGYTQGVKRRSSLSRRDLAARNLDEVEDWNEVLDAMAKQTESDPFMNPFRHDNIYKMRTIGQIMMNLNKLKFVYRGTSAHSEFKGYDNRLPDDYEPKIEVIILDSVKPRDSDD